MLKCLWFLALLGFAAFLIVFYRRRVNRFILAIVVAYAVLATRSLINLDDAEATTSVLLALGGLAIVWLATWLWVKYVEARRRGVPDDDT